MKCIVGCEESQAITIAFRSIGVEAYSNDIKPCTGGHPEWHIQDDVFSAIKTIKFDLGIFNPPCTFLAGSSVQWLSHPDDKELPFNLRRPHPKYPDRRDDMENSIIFVKKLYNCSIRHVCIENPVGLLSEYWMQPHQIIQPYQFGDTATKTTCLWLKNLPALKYTNIVHRGERVYFKSGKSHPKWYADAMAQAKTKEERQTLRSKTFSGIAHAMANQWSKNLPEQIKLF